ncbi:MAG: Poly-beta-1,6-N-acetyl-D-glucosamine N-deacetylase precursor [Syntrophorhabdaceae bacterium PtaU1.Bin034]|nr:MAG: Poly-beta-1,6-N-acetyl-D-glucosamine N-deacetylase precursor [Syntrophorhabdaceae bacterium PtaU1.Bin034]
MSINSVSRRTSVINAGPAVLLAALILIVIAPDKCLASDRFIALVYHDITVKSNVPEDLTPDELTRHFAFLKANGYHPISVSDIAAAAAGKKSLPEKAILLTFDDAYLSFYKIVYPALKLYGYPAVLSVVTSWTEGKNHPDGLHKEKKFMSWDMIKEVASSGLVTVASHSDDLHTYVHSNPHGNIEPASSTFAFDRRSQTYEAEERYRKRIRADMEMSVSVLQKKLGVKPNVYTWPYGAYNLQAIEEGKKAGFSMFLTTDSGFSDIRHPDRINRYYAQNMPKWLPRVAEELKQGIVNPTQIRAVQIDLDKIVKSESYKESDRNLGKCLDRLSSLGVNTVIVQAFNDSEGTGNVSALYFSNSALPVDMDFLSHAINRIKARGMQAFVWMPALAFELPSRENNEALWVRELKDGKVRIAESSYKRLSPFDERSLAISRAIFRDLAAYVNFDGILFQDDAYLTEKEDYHPAAAIAFRKAFGTDLTPTALSNEAVKKKWTTMKIAALNGYLSALIETVKTYRPTVKTARNICSEVVVDPGTEALFAQDLTSFLKNYDYTVIMASPGKIDSKPKARKWMSAMFDRVKKKNGTNKTIFKVQAYDWEKKSWIEESTLREQLLYLLALGARHVAYYPDGVIEDRPIIDSIAPIVSGQEYIEGIRRH